MPNLLAEFRVDPVLDSWLVAIFLLVALIGMPIYQWRRSRLGTRDHVIFSMRLVASIAVALLLLRPVWVQETQAAQETVLTMALDQSVSMTLPDRGDRSRFETQIDAAVRLRRLLDQHQLQNLSIRTIGYGERIRELDLATIPDLIATDTQTDMSQVFRQAGLGTSSSGGLVIFGDGTTATQAGRLDVDGLRDSVRAIDRAGIPVYSVPLGAPGIETARDVAIESLPDAYQLFAGNSVDIDFVLRTSGVVTGSVPVKLRWIDASGTVVDIAERVERPARQEQSFALSVPVVVPAPGMYQLQVESPPRSGETIVSNNRQTSFVQVQDGGGRILYIEGEPRSEQIFLRRTVGRFPDLDLTYQLIPSSSQASWPIDIAGQIPIEDFDSILLGDLPAAAIDDRSWSIVAEQVESGTGLIVLGGIKSYGAGGYGQSPIGKLFPIAIPSTDGGGQAIDGPIVLRPTGLHPIVDMGSDTDSRWRNAAAMPGANRFGKLKPLPGVKTVLQDEMQNPMLVIGNYGRGRIASLAFDSTWRWWRSGDDQMHRRFWRQLLLWSMDRSNQRDMMTIEMKTRRLLLGQKTNFLATMETSDDSDVEFSASVIDSRSQTQMLETTMNDTGTTGLVGPEAAGIYRLRVAAKKQVMDAAGSPSTEETSAEIEFEVVDRQIEFEHPKPDFEWMNQIASMTSSHGGQSYRSDAMQQLADAIAARQRSLMTPRQSQSRLGEGLASAWALFLLIGLATTGQWVLRRRWRLP